MRRLPLLVPALAVLFAVTACGAERAGDAGASGSAGRSGASAVPVTDPGIDGVRITSVSLPSSPSPRPSGDYVVRPDSLARLTAAYEVVNKGAATMTYTVTVSFRSASGGAMDNRTVTVNAVAPGKTVTGTTEAIGVAGAVTAKVIKVAKVPTAEAPSTGGACPASGVRVYADQGDAAMGLRVVGIHLENCGTAPYSLDGYPELTLLDDQYRTVDGVKILKGTGDIPMAPDSAPPTRITLKPGERARSGLAWRNTTGFGDAENVPYVRVRARSGADPVVISPSLDLGTTGQLGVGAWELEKR
ncbi:DUF4232 domain-containing protein [Streptomyces acidiscabies]|uniref:DUF4232 domain-containing protein n=1 Tax=Streptomyces acidiscabies TaxID=42234 RepID=A0AAP6EFD9_9ACTN|nr:DUF4232 domain-containing protein [Streptomyces acidiscabies]MBP5936309.1 DUF4232 domain-containing protein [Streptomyces sp. LBUM 1476]MBZ3915735.1 DUF4232 domain-containing protein [Streptomyces acidiscabies]MDX2960141.1 DUF4232 domain-containing protein [Streptomyces acidiscabies]MDX3019492.1 DUF4232 domain-containing protein [Streptomyces acidiscabies]MDX3793109.1 DUF4232 domain-containing protein [Streptomyces acidiscabies]